MEMSRRAFCGSLAAGAAGAALWPAVCKAGPDGSDLPRPTPQQLAWQDFEVGMFIHFGMATFSGSIWATPKPDTYNPTRLDTDQWMEAAKAFGAKYAVFTAKHCAGFMQWQTDLYPYSVKLSSWQDGKGDTLKRFVESCHKFGIRPGVYVSATANAFWKAKVCRVRGGDAEAQAKYSRMLEKMYAEVWSRYGEFAEIWFDGGVLPVSQGGPDIWDLQQKLQPNAIVHDNGAGPHGHQRWGGSERDGVGYPCWATIKGYHTRFEQSPYYRIKKRLTHMYRNGDPDGDRWMPAEADPVFDGNWFAGRKGPRSPRSLEDLMKLYYETVGRNTNLLLNCNPGADGLVPESHMERYGELGKEIARRFEVPVAETKGDGDALELALKRPGKIDHVIIMEDIQHGERVRAYEVEGLVPGNTWRKLCEGISVGHKRIQKFDSTEVARLRLKVTSSAAAPKIRRLAVFDVG
jgi:alpha-L-fucosidase